MVVAFFKAERPSPKAGAMLRVRIDELRMPTEEDGSMHLDESDAGTVTVDS